MKSASLGDRSVVEKKEPMEIATNEPKTFVA